MRWIHNGLLFFAMMVAGGCDGATSTKQVDMVLVFAAASTTDVFDELKALFEKQQPVRVRVNYAGSSTLAQQIHHGAEADLFLSANQAWADSLQEAGLVDQQTDLLGNRLVLIVRSGSDFRPTRLEELVGRSVKHVAVADPESVPAGMYAKQALKEIGIWEQVKSKLIIGVHVRHVLSHVEQGGADVGIVYATDAAMSDAVDLTAEIDPVLTEPIRYRIVLLKTGSGGSHARQLYEFLTSNQAASVFRKFGFSVVE